MTWKHYILHKDSSFSNQISALCSTDIKACRWMRLTPVSPGLPAVTVHSWESCHHTENKALFSELHWAWPIKVQDVFYYLPFKKCVLCGSRRVQINPWAHVCSFRKPAGRHFHHKGLWPHGGGGGVAFPCALSLQLVLIVPLSWFFSMSMQWVAEMLLIMCTRSRWWTQKGYLINKMVRR